MSDTTQPTKLPPTGRVRMLRTVTDAEIAEQLGQPSAGDSRYGKGELVHFHPDVAVKLVAAEIAAEDIDPDYGATSEPTEQPAIIIDDED